MNVNEKSISERICEAYDKGRKDGEAHERENAAYLRGFNKGMAAKREAAVKKACRCKESEAWGALGNFIGEIHTLGEET